jgi:hypothetical protein
MMTEVGVIDMTGPRKVYELLDELERHINAQDASGRALLYQAKERMRMLIISLDRNNSAGTIDPNGQRAR